ncbi:MAG TPA: aspartate-semialdehyde dehydrogenase [Candidatus Dormibacteraeota bacterium]|nr:aspartate-semialdehyde dehydrogenase [Candidatus Dormibacteraeota bacterium]
MKRYRVGVLGATGAVGQRLVQLLDGHPWFDLTEVVASERSSDRPYGEAVSWRLGSRIPQETAGLVVKPLSKDLDCDLVLSALDSQVAGEAEDSLASAGFPVISNARNHRLDDDVPLLIPEVNWEHARVLPHQRAVRHYSTGLIATNPNCSAIGLAMVLKPLQDAFGVSEVLVVTLQALSGAGIQGVAAMTILDNVIPYVAGEEEKIETESLKILGGLDGERFLPADLRVSAQCNRVAVLDGHTEAVSVRLRRPASGEQLRQAFAEFTSEPQRLQLPSAPPQPILVIEGVDRPQPQLDREAAQGMAVSVGNIRPCPVLDWKFTLVVHNAIRGAAGAALLNAELLVAQGYVG